MDEETQTSEEEGDFMKDLIGLNAKAGYDAFLMELMEGARQNRLQNAQVVAASLDNVRNLQQASADHVRGMNTLNQMTIQGTKILQEKQLDTTAHEIAAETASVAAALSAMNGANRQTDSTSAQAMDQLLAQMAALTAAIAQMQTTPSQG